MRITTQQRGDIIALTAEIAGAEAEVFLFGSRTDDNKRGGDVDLLIELVHEVENPALLAASLSSGISRLMEGRKVDVVLSAPNLEYLPIHEVAKANGIRL